MKNQYELKKFMVKNGLVELPEPVWISDFFMNTYEGNIIRDLKPELVFPVLNLKNYTSSLSFFKVGKKGEKLKSTISPYSKSNGSKYSQFFIYDSEEEANIDYLKKMDNFISLYENNINIHKKKLSSLKKEFELLSKKDL